MEFNSTLCGCGPQQIINFNYAFTADDIECISIYNNCGDAYSSDDLEYAYSLDNVCWSCYMSYDDLLTSTVDLNSDFYLRIKISNVIGSIKFKGEAFTNYTTSIASGFKFTYCDGTTTNTNTFNPYTNMECAIQLQQQLVETVSCMFGIPIYYFKLSPNAGSRDVSFKEYTLMDVESVKQIKLVVTDGTMPSSKPEFNDWGLEWQTDWETEISKGMFATAFGSTAQPMEGDLIYIPMMKRMWMVNEAYEEKNGNLMWNATTFKVALVKYQEKDSVDLGNTEELVNSFVKNKYEDLFGEQENVDAQSDMVNSPSKSVASNLLSIYESDAVRKAISIDNINFYKDNTYYKGTLISENCYKFNPLSILNGNSTYIIYQKQYCGSEGACSFILKCNYENFTTDLIKIGSITINIKQNGANVILTVLNNGKSLTILSETYYFIYLIWSKSLNTIVFSAAKYSWPENMPKYRLNSHVFYYDIDNAISESSKYNLEFTQEEKSEVSINGFYGIITNFKLFDVYNDDTSELLQMYPTHQHLIINDTARQIVDLNGVKI